MPNKKGGTCRTRRVAAGEYAGSQPGAKGGVGQSQWRSEAVMNFFLCEKPKGRAQVR